MSGGPRRAEQAVDGGGCLTWWLSPLFLATLAGKMRVDYIRVSPGDRLTLELSPYDLMRGRITYRHR